ncbi:MAG: HTH domain-containing protein [Planctomycetota bacterium]|jgi:biotin operon repressor
MPTRITDRSGFTQTLAIHAALRLALRQRLFADQPQVRQAADKLLAALESDRSIYGRQARMLTMMRDGTTIDAMGRKLRCSRRTVFRYLNQLETAGLEISLEEQRYRVSGALLKNLLK